jgi:hypothetical protein
MWLIEMVGAQIIAADIASAQPQAKLQADTRCATT